MFIIIPLVFFLISAGYLAFTLTRKFEYLKKISPEAIHDRPASWQTFWAEMFPGVVSLGERIEWQENKVHFLAESEKLLRRMRLFFLRIDGSIHTLLNRLRRKTKREEEVLQKQEDAEEMQATSALLPATLDPKQEEQLLIMEIAKDPKDPLLYRKLGDIYIKMGDDENARNSFATVLDLDPENWYAKKKLEKLPA